MPTTEYRRGVELLVPAYASSGDQHEDLVFRIEFVLNQLSAPPGYVVVRGLDIANDRMRVLTLPLGLQLASRGVVYGPHAFVPAEPLVRGYVLSFQEPTRYQGPYQYPRVAEA